MDATVDTSSQVTGPHAAHNAGVLATLPAADPDTLTCAVCEKEKAKTVFARREDWPAPDEPLCRKCRDDARSQNEEERADLKEIAALEALTHEEEIALHRQKRLQMLAALTTHKIKQASIKDLTIGLKNLFPIEQLLQNKPTQIVDSQDRQALMDVAKMLREERARRAKTIDVTPTRQDVA